MSTATTKPRAVWVTGANSGIGAACVTQLRQAGFQVFAGVRTVAGAEAVRARHGEAVVPLVCDLAEPEQIQEAMATLGRHLGERPLWGLVNNAGMVVPGPVELLMPDALPRQFAANLFGPVALIQGCCAMLRACGGRIINISSINGRVGKPYIGAYCASKHALEGLTDALRLELKPMGVAVVLVEPGSVRTPIWGKAGAVMASTVSGAGGAADVYTQACAALQRSGAARAGQAPTSSEAVAAVILKALQAPSPRARYVVGFDARLQLLLRWLLPTAVMDRIILKGLQRALADTKPASV